MEKKGRLNPLPYSGRDTRVLDSKTLKSASDNKSVLRDKCVNKENGVEVLKPTLLPFGFRIFCLPLCYPKI